MTKYTREQRRAIQLQQKRTAKKITKFINRRQSLVKPEIQFEVPMKGLPSMSNIISDYSDKIGDGYDLEQVLDMVSCCWNIGIYQEDIADLLWQVLIQTSLDYYGLQNDEQVIQVLRSVIELRSTRYKLDPRFVLEFKLTPLDGDEVYFQIKSEKQDPEDFLKRYVDSAPYLAQRMK
ncbi:hypothetical protein D5018_18995 [Parashewanella curva]|uniref:Uncharacterized protein n=1 Tax=Parashewanella curva TaxID=2338552 RepID=A0A3L8PTH5_9GAMM|nr:hypothetical protein [Parashewanella curva]RLV58109.1 hypothetical protein D5018_18995 [Parashewanella curva]